MSINIVWANSEQTAIHIAFAPGWTWEHLKSAIQRADSMIASVEHTVHLLIDLSSAGGIPGDFMTMAGDILNGGAARVNEGAKVVVGAGRLIRMAYGGFLRVYGQQLKGRPFLFASDIDEAQAIITAQGITP